MHQTADPEVTVVEFGVAGLAVATDQLLTAFAGGRDA
ncbi:hypothetical protein SAMN04489732_101371 [Amycolatopsis saalfeldensis]|uniref:Uncharacterized protein n=1 Tax=Amycolatopsis saalfeldensis TaxID=394193 RepID=A0A1H8QJ94_9PSEU|nr:hypothetical protein SAMN04489732_101371 [Amycolatopsis saalfeldensis]